MPTERFSREEFEAALPSSKDGLKLWRHLGLIDGEHHYVLPIVHPHHPEREAEVEIYIQSSVDSSNFAADTGADSIRVTLVDSVSRKPLATKAAKTQRWVARTKNWRTNLLTVLRESFKMGCELGTCPKCKVAERYLRRSTKRNDNEGRLYVACEIPNCYFKWLDWDDVGLKIKEKTSGKQTKTA